MADNITVNPSTGVSAIETIAFDEVVGAGKFQRIKQDIGGDGASVPFTDPSTGARQDTGNASLASIVSAVDGIEALITTLNASVATQATLAAVLAKIIAAPATEAKQDTGNASLVSILAATDGIEALQGTANASLASLVTQTDTVESVLSSIDTKATDGATQTTLAAVLAKIIAAPATEALQTALNALHPALVTTIPADSSSAPPVRVVPADLWRTSFADVGAGLLAPELTLLQTGGGHGVSQGSSNLLITTGTTANAETLIRSVRTFRGAHIMRYRLQLSQRIVNNNFEIAFADLVGAGLAFTINSATSVTVTFTGTNPFAAGVGQFCNLSQIAGAAGIPGRFAVASVAGLTATFTVAGWPASGSGTLTLWGWNTHRVLYSGTTATAALYDSQRRGWASGDTTLAISTTAAPGHVGHLQGTGSMAGFADALIASTAAYQFTPRASRVENLPDDAQEMYLWIRVLNGTTAPASTTTLTLGFVSVEMTGRQKVYLSGGDQMGAPMAPAVQVANFPASQPVSLPTNTPTLAAGTNLAGDVGMQVRANATGAMTPNKVLAAASTNATLIKATAGRVFGWRLVNTTAAIKVVRLHNLAVVPTVGTSVPAYVIFIPANGVAEWSSDIGIAHATGISYSITNGIADLDATAVAANDVLGFILSA